MISKSIFKEVNAFADAGKAVIHSEWIHGSGCETIIAGDMIGMLYCISCTLKRICEKAQPEQKYEDALELLRILESKDGPQIVKNGDTVPYSDGEDIVERIRNEEAAKAEKKFMNQLEAQAREIERYKNAEKLHGIQLKNMQKKTEDVRAEGAKRVDSLQRELRSKESEIRKLMQKIQKLGEAGW